MVTTYLKALLGHKKLSKSTAWSQNVLGPWRVNVGMSNKTNGTTLFAISGISKAKLRVRNCFLSQRFVF